MSRIHRFLLALSRKEPLINFLKKTDITPIRLTTHLRVKMNNDN